MAMAKLAGPFRKYARRHRKPTSLRRGFKIPLPPKFILVSRWDSVPMCMMWLRNRNSFGHVDAVSIVLNFGCIAEKQTNTDPCAFCLAPLLQKSAQHREMWIQNVDHAVPSSCIRNVSSVI